MQVGVLKAFEQTNCRGFLDMLVAVYMPTLNYIEHCIKAGCLTACKLSDQVTCQIRKSKVERWFGLVLPLGCNSPPNGLKRWLRFNQQWQHVFARD